MPGRSNHTALKRRASAKEYVELACEALDALPTDGLFTPEPTARTRAIVYAILAVREELGALARDLKA